MDTGEIGGIQGSLFGPLLGKRKYGFFLMQKTWFSHVWILMTAQTGSYWGTSNVAVLFFQFIASFKLVWIQRECNVIALKIL